MLRGMRTIFQKMMTWMTVIVLITGFAVPHICLDDHGPTVKAEQHLKTAKIALDDHETSKAKDHACVSHHCCFAKVVNIGQVVAEMVAYADITLIAPSTVYFSSFDPKGLDRPPKFFA